MNQTCGAGNRGRRTGPPTHLRAAALALALVVSPGAATAATFSVDSTVDAPDFAPGDGLCEESPGGDCTLRAAVMEANALSGDDLISVPAGTFSISIPPGPPFDDQTGDLDIVDEIHIQGAGAGVTLLDAGGIDRMFAVDPGQIGGFAAEIIDLTIHNGDASNGGAIWNLGTLELGDCVLEGNTATNNGGAIFNSGAGDLTVTRCSILGNSAGIGSGGGIANFHPAVLRIHDSLIEGNTAQFSGGGLSNESIAAPVGATIERSTIRGNFAHTDFEFFGGGGIQNTGSLRVFHSTISGNQATQADGGGIANLGAAISLFNTTVSGNSAASEGGGIFGEANLTACTITDNSAASIGGVFGPVFAQISILAANAGGNCSEPVDAGCEWPNLDSGFTCGLICPGSLVGTDPLLGSLAANGGLTETHALLAGSPAIDAADPVFGCPFALEPGGGVVQLADDQRGRPRPADGDDDGSALCDFGAFEVQDTPFFEDGFESGDTSAWSAAVG